MCEADGDGRPERRRDGRRGVSEGVAKKCVLVFGQSLTCGESVFFFQKLFHFGRYKMFYDRCMLVSEMLMTSAALCALGGTEI